MSARPAALAALLLSAAACSSPLAPNGADRFETIRTTTSFGFCLGYCRTSLEITPDAVVLVEEGTRENLPPRRWTRTLSSTEWNELVALADAARFDALPDVVGCPDCADGGAESLEVVGRGWRERVTFEFGADLREVQPLLDRVRALRERARS